MGTNGYFPEGKAAGV